MDSLKQFFRLDMLYKFAQIVVFFLSNLFTRPSRLFFGAILRLKRLAVLGSDECLVKLECFRLVIFVCNCQHDLPTQDQVEFVLDVANFEQFCVFFCSTKLELPAQSKHFGRTHS